MYFLISRLLFRKRFVALPQSAIRALFLHEFSIRLCHLSFFSASVLNLLYHCITAFRLVISVLDC